MPSIYDNSIFQGETKTETMKLNVFKVIQKEATSLQCVSSMEIG